MDKELFRKVRRIQITTQRMVTDTFSGEYRSVFKGQGMEFAEVREYMPGDEIRSIDWNVTARMGRPFVKQFTEERELTVCFMVDVSGSMEFGSHQESKRELAAEISAVLAFAATRNNDKVGLLLFSDEIELFIPPAKGRRHVLRIIRELLAFRSVKTKRTSAKTDLRKALDYYKKVQRKKSVCFLISDYFTDNVEENIKLFCLRHELTAFLLRDKKEITLPLSGMISLTDMETGEIVDVDLSDAKVNKKLNDILKDDNDRLKNIFARCKVDCLSIHPGEDYVKALTSYFRVREKRNR